MAPTAKRHALEDENGVTYSFALEYSGPPVSSTLPRALPINLKQIPVASVVSQAPLSEKSSLPVVQPILTNDLLSDKLCKELNLPGLTVSPTSVIENSRECVSKELDLASEETASTSTVSANSLERGNDGKLLSRELSISGALELEFCNNNANYASDEVSDVIIDNEANTNDILHNLDLGLSSTMEFSDSFDISRGETSRCFRKSNVGEGNLDFDDGPSRPHWESNDSAMSLECASSRVSSRRIGDFSNEPNIQGRRNPIVTFQDIESEDNLDEEFSKDNGEAFQSERELHSRGKKGSCYRCLKGNRFTEKEVCIVCDAKYCSNCVLRAMGSMPEGRKCVSCIGYPIAESKRGSLGKCSRMLKRLLNDLEIKQIMKAEEFCEANQLPPEYVCVNGKPLCCEELAVLQNCPNPPKNLKPGNYWYDKVSGLWGKEGQKPSKIISPHLNVGGPIRPNASNGKTGVFINGREITKVEFRMLQLAGVQCAGNPHFWVNEDGSYQEEGQKNTKGYIWGKAGTKVLCAFLSLPVPSRSSNSYMEPEYCLDNRSIPHHIVHQTLQKILLVGCNGSGTSTIFKQAKILYKTVPFSADEQENIKLKIQSNVYNYLGILLEGRERFEEECLSEMKKKQACDGTNAPGNTGVETIYSIGPRLKAFSDWLLKTMVSGNLEAVFPAATREYAPVVEELWKDSAIQATFSRRTELEMLPSVSSYFLEHVADILRADYEPSDMDILYAEGVTSSNGLSCVDFSFPQSTAEESADTAYQHNPLLRYQLIRVHARGLGENCKWLEMFEDIGIVVFCVSLSDYDQYTLDADGCLINNMLLSKRFFKSIVAHPTFEQMDFLLLLNKYDLFEEKIERVSLTQCEWFDDFHPVVTRHRSSSSSSINSNPTLGQIGFHYIAVKFKRLYSSLIGRKLYVSAVKGLEPDSIDAALRYAREIMKWDEERVNFSLNELSFYSTEASSFSH